MEAGLSGAGGRGLRWGKGRRLGGGGGRPAGWGGVCEGEGEITAPPLAALLPSRELRELGRGGEGEPAWRSLPGEPGGGVRRAVMAGGERFLRCPRPVREVGVGNGPARRCRVPPFPHPPTPPPCAWQPPRSLLRPCLPGARRGGGREKGARAFLPAAWGICAGKSPWCEGMFVRPRQEAEEGEFPHPPGNGTSGPG